MISKSEEKLITRSIGLLEGTRAYKDNKFIRDLLSKIDDLIQVDVCDITKFELYNHAKTIQEKEEEIKALKKSHDLRVNIRLNIHDLLELEEARYIQQNK
jgi:hypothetical protein